MNQDEIWDRIKEDKDEVYGMSMLDMFLKLTEKLVPKHYEELPADKRKLLDPEIRLQNTTSVDEADRAIKDGATGLGWALRSAVKRGHSEMIKMLIDRGSGGIDEALHVSAKKGQLEMVKFLMARGADVNRRVDVDYSGGSLNGAIPPLRRAAENGHLDVVEFLVDNGAKDFNGSLWSASRGGNLEVVKFLADKGGENLDFDEALSFAASHGHLEVVDFLLNKAPKKLDRTLHTAAREGHLEIVKFLVEKGAKGLDNAFLPAAERGHLEVIDYLLDRVDDPKKAVLYAYQYGSKKVVDFLKSRGAK
jgi:ankyrin repeat protein